MSNSNLDLYNRVREVPKEAKKPIKGGRLKGYTNINPMWRIKKLTEEFGICGIGWYTKTIKKWIEPGANGELVAFVDIELYVKNGDKWSIPIEGSGGSMVVEKETCGLYTSDECYKMAYTDALSVACKSLGIGADVYWEEGKTKYDKLAENSTSQPNPQEQQALNKRDEVFKVAIELNKIESITKQYKVKHFTALSEEQIDDIYNKMFKKAG